MRLTPDPARRPRAACRNRPTPRSRRAAERETEFSRRRSPQSTGQSDGFRSAQWLTIRFSGREQTPGLRLEPEPVPAYVLARSENTMLDRIGALLAPILPSRFRPGVVVVPVVRLSGIIGFTTPLRPGLTLSGIARSLERAFTWPNA